jgi:hypothetical protein
MPLNKKIIVILKSIIDIPEYYINPDCLGAAILSNDSELIERLLSSPYSIIPNEPCLAYAIELNNFNLIKRFFKDYTIKLTELSLQYAITAANVKMTKYLIDIVKVPINKQLYMFIIKDTQDDDEKANITFLKRRKLNRIIRSHLRKVFAEEGY